MSQLIENNDPGANAQPVAEANANNTQLLESQKMQSIVQLTSGIAHEINTSLQYVGDNMYFLENAFHAIDQLFEKCHCFISVHRSNEAAVRPAGDTDCALKSFWDNFFGKLQGPL